MRTLFSDQREGNTFSISIEEKTISLSLTLAVDCNLGRGGWDFGVVKIPRDTFAQGAQKFLQGESYESTELKIEKKPDGPIWLSAGPPLYITRKSTDAGRFLGYPMAWVISCSKEKEFMELCRRISEETETS